MEDIENNSYQEHIMGMRRLIRSNRLKYSYSEHVAMLGALKYLIEAIE